MRNNDTVAAEVRLPRGVVKEDSIENMVAVFVEAVLFTIAAAESLLTIGGQV
jgi:hypothetical protein